MRNVEGGSLQKHARLDSVSQPTLESGQLVFERLVDATHKRRRNVYNRRAWRIHIEPRTNPGQIGGHNLAAARKSLDHHKRQSLEKRRQNEYVCAPIRLRQIRLRKPAEKRHVGNATSGARNNSGIFFGVVMPSCKTKPQTRRRTPTAARTFLMCRFNKVDRLQKRRNPFLLPNLSRVHKLDRRTRTYIIVARIRLPPH